MSRLFAIVAVAAMFAGPAHAQPQYHTRILPIHPPNPPLHQPLGYRHVTVSYPTPEKRVENLAGLLDLSPRQKSEVLAVFVDQDTQLFAVRNDSSMADNLRRKKIDDLRDATVDKVRALLTDEQKKKYDALAPAKPAAGKPHLEPDFSVPY